MLCTECKKRFQKPLILFTGDRACPNCLKSLFPEVTTPEVTVENHRLFSLSEDLFYMGYLLKEEGVPTTSEERRRKLDDAINYCREAARMKNPYAMLRLGYYYSEGFITDASSDNFSRLAASRLYTQLVNASEFLLRGYIVNGKVQSKYLLQEAEVESLKEEAKRRLEYLSSLKEENLEEEPVIKTFLSTLSAMHAGGERAPLFAIFRLDREQLFNALADEACRQHPERVGQARMLLNTTQGLNDAGRNNKRTVISEVAKYIGAVEMGVRTNPTFDFKLLGDRADCYKWEPFFGSTSAWTSVEYGREYGYFYLFNAAYKNRRLDVKRLAKHLLKFAPLYVSDEMMARSDSALFYPDDFLYHFRKAGQPAYGKKDLSQALITSYLENK